MTTQSEEPRGPTTRRTGNDCRGSPPRSARQISSSILSTTPAVRSLPYGGAIDAENNSIKNRAAGVGIYDNQSGPEVVTGNTFNSIAQSAVAVSSAPPPTIENNVAVDVGSLDNHIRPTRS